MARTDTFVAATPEQVWAVLSDPESYGYWVVGTREVRDVDPGWPRPGTRFHHSVELGPLCVDGQTISLRAEEPHLLELRARARPLGTAMVRLELEPEGNGTRVTLVEDAGDLLSAFVFSPLTHIFVRGRNSESLRRLAQLAGRRRVPAPA